MRFRETLWFKHGMNQDNAPHEGDELEPEPGDAAPSNRLLPVEDRYTDDGSVRLEDSQAYGLHTGRTQGLPMFAPVESTGIREEILISEMKGGRMLIVGAAAAVVILFSALLIVAH